MVMVLGVRGAGLGGVISTVGGALLPDACDFPLRDKIL